MVLTVLSSLSFPFTGIIRHPLAYTAGAMITGGLLLIIPGWRWVRNQSEPTALILFNRACVYPLAMFAVAVISIL